MPIPGGVIAVDRETFVPSGLCVYLDTSAVVAAFAEPRSRHNSALRFFDDLAASGQGGSSADDVTVVTSELLDLELVSASVNRAHEHLRGGFHQVALDDPGVRARAAVILRAMWDRWREYRDNVLCHDDPVRLSEIPPHDVLTAMRTHDLQSNDAHHLCAADLAGCNALATFDRQLAVIPQKVMPYIYTKHSIAGDAIAARS